MIQREGAPTLKRGPTADDDTAIADWANLPQGTLTEYLDASLHDAEVVSIRSDLLERTLSIRCDIEHLRAFHRWPEGFQLLLELEGVQSARVFRYSIWPGEFSVPAGVSHERSPDSFWNIRRSGERSRFRGQSLRRRLLANVSKSSTSRTLHSLLQKSRWRSGYADTSITPCITKCFCEQRS